MATRTMIIALAGGLAGITACTQVLGLERAELEEAGGGAGGGAGGAGSGGQGGATQSPDSVVWFGCEVPPSAGCAGCVESCGVEQCLKSTACRRSFDAYEGCRGPSCDPEKAEEQCAATLHAEVQDCVIGCLDDCSETAVVSNCQYTCGCMADACGETEPFDACVAACEALPPEVSVCFRRHCRAAALARTAESRESHCRHARNEPSAICRNNDELPPEDRAADCGLDKNPTDWACEVSSQCCSSRCNNGVCD